MRLLRGGANEVPEQKEHALLRFVGKFQSALTGESDTVERTPDMTVYSGSVVQHGEATAIVLATGVQTYFGRTTQLVESAHPKLHVQEV